MTSWRGAPTLAGVHVTLRPLAPDDRDALVAVASAGDLWDTFYASVARLKDADAWMEATLAERDRGRDQRRNVAAQEVDARARRRRDSDHEV